MRHVEQNESLLIIPLSHSSAMVWRGREGGREGGRGREGEIFYFTVVHTYTFVHNYTTIKQENCVVVLLYVLMDDTAYFCVQKCKCSRFFIMR